MSSMAKKAKSDVWKYFIKESSSTARCVLCTKVLKHGGNTTNLHNHFKNVHKLHIARESPSKKTSLDQQKSSIKDAANKENELNEATCSTSSFDLTLQRQEQSLNNADMDIDDPVVIEQSISDPESQNRPATRLHSFQGRKLVKSKETKNYRNVYKN